MNRITLIIYGLLAIPMPEVQALERVLLEPLSAAEEVDARLQNGYFLPKETFTAKQYRLVKVNMELLETDGELVIPLFDGDEMTVNSTEIKINEVSGYLEWHGEREGHPDQPSWEIFEKDLADQGVNSEQAKVIYNSVIQHTEVRIVMSYYERDEETGANLNPVHGILDAMSPCKVDRFSRYSSDPNYVRGASASLKSLDNERSYRLEMMGMGGPYHVLYEIDSARVMTPGNDMIVPGQPYQSGLTPEQDQKNARLRREKNALELTIGPNPHDALYEERILKLRASDAKALQEAQQRQVTPVIQGCETN